MILRLSNIFGDKNLFKSVFVVALPIVLQQLISSSVLLVDNVMVGSLGEESLSAVATVNQILFIIYMASFGLTGGAGIFVTQFFGAKDSKNVKNSITYKIFSSLILATIGVIVVMLFKHEIIGLFLEKGSTSYNIALSYINIVWPSVFFTCFVNVFSTSLREMFKPVYSMISGITAIVLNTSLNALLIFGLLSFPKLGVEGAALATVIAKLVELVLSYLFYKIKLKDNVPSFKELFYLNKNFVKKITLKAFPLTFNEIMWSFARTILFYTYATRGEAAIAGINITNTVSNLAFAFSIGIATAVQIIVGAKLGNNELDEANHISKKLISISILVSLVTSGITILFSTLFLNLYSISEITRMVAYETLIIYLLLLVITTINMVLYFLLRSGGAIKETILADIGITYILTIPVALIVSHYTKIDIVLLFLVVNIIDSMKIFVSFYFYKKGVWLVSLAIDNINE